MSKDVRERIDIEELLIRAYYTKKLHKMPDVKAAALGLMGPRSAGGGYSTDDKVDTSSFAARMAAQLREMQERLARVPSGLADLHDAVLGLPDFFVERGAGLDWNVWDAETAAQMGHRIEAGRDGATIVAVARRGGRGPGRDDLLPTGEPRRLLRIVTSTVVIQAGASPDRPYVPALEIVRYEPILSGADKRAVGHRPVYEPPLHVVIEGRAAYAIWHAALGILAEAFTGSGEFEVTGPRAPAEPWENVPRILAAIERPAVAPKRRRAKKSRPAKKKQPISMACAVEGVAN